jgi:hypothetical protein
MSCSIDLITQTISQPKQAVVEVKSWRRRVWTRLNRWLFLIPFILAFINANSQSPQMPQTSSQQNVPAHAFTRDTAIYVSDFELHAEQIQTDRALLGAGTPQGVLRRPIRQAKDDPRAHAREIVALMSRTIIEDLRKAGYTALPLVASDPRPSSGEWVHGVFAEVDEGDRLRRAVIGFGSGQATMTLFVLLTDLSTPDKPIYQSALDGSSGKSPGAIITLNPYVAATKFVLGKNATDKMVKKTAGEIAKQIATQLSQLAAKPASP